MKRKAVLKRTNLHYKITVLVLLTAMLSVIPAMAMAQQANGGTVQKEENIYASLGSDGSFRNAYVVNSFVLDQPGLVEDYGEYDAVRNLTTTDELGIKEGKVTINAPAGQFYYQGNINGLELPWLVTVSYLLDGKETGAEKLSGADGQLQIRIRIRKNPAAGGDFEKHYAVQTSVTLNTKVASGITAEGATIANAGGSKVITWTMLPGSEADYTISAKIAGFHMDGIQLSAVPFSMDIETPDTGIFTDKLSQLTDGIEKLDNGASDLKVGAEDLKKGTGELKNGMQAIQPGVSGISEGLQMLAGQNASLTGGSQEFLTGLTALRDSLPEQMAQLKGTLTQLITSYEILNSGLQAYTEGVAELGRNSTAVKEGYAALVNGAQSLYSGISKYSEGAGQLAGGIAQLRKGTSSIDSEVDAAVSELMASFTGGEFEPVSFISAKNTDVEAVQFILLTDGIDEPDPEVPEKAEEKKLTFWERLLALFGL